MQKMISIMILVFSVVVCQDRCSNDTDCTFLGPDFWCIAGYCYNMTGNIDSVDCSTQNASFCADLYGPSFQCNVTLRQCELIWNTSTGCNGNDTVCQLGLGDDWFCNATSGQCDYSFPSCLNDTWCASQYGSSDWTCNATSGQCEYNINGCSDNADCTILGPDYACVFGYCLNATSIFNDTCSADADCPTDYYCRDFGIFSGCVPGCTTGLNVTDCSLYGQICNTQTLRCEDSIPSSTTPSPDDESTTEGMGSTMTTDADESNVSVASTSLYVIFIIIGVLCVGIIILVLVKMLKAKSKNAKYQSFDEDNKVNLSTESHNITNGGVELFKL